MAASTANFGAKRALPGERNGMRHLDLNCFQGLEENSPPRVLRIDEPCDGRVSASESRDATCFVNDDIGRACLRQAQPKCVAPFTPIAPLNSSEFYSGSLVEAVRSAFPAGSLRCASNQFMTSCTFARWWLG